MSPARERPANNFSTGTTRDSFPSSLTPVHDDLHHDCRPIQETVQTTLGSSDGILRSTARHIPALVDEEKLICGQQRMAKALPSLLPRLLASHCCLKALHVA